jgi:peptide/nickel transport system ATP-binding protein
VIAVNNVQMAITDVVLTAEALRVDAIDAGCDIVDGIGFALRRGETLAIVGESGSGKTTIAVALLGMARAGTRLAGGRVLVADIDLVSAPERKRAALRGYRVAYVPQNPATALSPGQRVGRQLSEVVQTHLPEGGDAAGRVQRAFASAQLPVDDAFLRRYPHELSGGQQQRVCIAMALVCNPDVIVMDEPTTGLDVTTQARLLEEIRELGRRLHTAMVYISHDLAVVRNIADRVIVLYAGRIVEEASADALFATPRHPYTRRLLEAIPRVDVGRARPRGIPGSAVEPRDRPSGCPFAARCDLAIDRCRDTLPELEHIDGRAVRCIRWRDAIATGPVIEVAAEIAEPRADPAKTVLSVEGLVAGYGRRGRQVVAVNGVSLTVWHGSCLGVVGESGSGKSTLLRCVAGLHEQHDGKLLFDGESLPARARARSRDTRRRIQLVPQDPDASLNPFYSIGAIVGRPLLQFYGLRGAEQERRVGELLERVRLRAAFAERMPRELSGGEKQRVAIARAIAAAPDLLLCDEVTSALDVAVQAGILTLLDELRRDLGMALMFVSHDLAVVRSISDDVVVMCDGVVRETRPADELFENPHDDYTRELLAAVPRLRDEDYPPTRLAYG